MALLNIGPFVGPGSPTQQFGGGGGAPLFNPEADLGEPTSVVPFNTAGIPGTLLNQTAPGVFAVDITGWNPVQGLIAEFGSFVGSVCGVTSTGRLIVAVGSVGSTNKSEFRSQAPLTGSGTLVVAIDDIDPSANPLWRIRVWWQGVEVPPDPAFNHQFSTSTFWTSGDSTTTGANAGNYMTTTPGSLSSAMEAITTANFIPASSYTTWGDLRHYANAVVSP